MEIFSVKFYSGYLSGSFPCLNEFEATYQKISYSKIYEQFSKGEKIVTKRKKTDVPATKVAGLAQKNLAFDILEAKLKEELHGEDAQSS